MVRAYFERIAREPRADFSTSGAASAPRVKPARAAPHYVPSAAAAAGRADFATIAGWVGHGARVLDLGCGDGSLLAYLARERDVDRLRRRDRRRRRARERAATASTCCRATSRRGLAGFDDASFDCVILSQTLQAMRRIEAIVAEMLRVGREAIVTFPNFGHWSHRLQILRGRMPVSKALPYQWYDTPNIHLCTVADFDAFLASAATSSRTASCSPAAAPVDVRCRTAAASSRSTASAGASDKRGGADRRSASCR